MNRIARLFEPVDISSLAFFRIAFGLCLVIHTAPHVLEESFFLDAAAPALHFPYPLLEWIRPVSREAMKMILLAMLVAAGGITLGLAYRLSVLVYALGAGYFHFVDAAKFHNHYYLIVLLTFLMIFMPAHGGASIDAWIRPGLRRTITPRWTVWLLRFQVGVPFFFSGLSKLNAEWLHGLPALFHWHSFTIRYEWARALDPGAMALLIAWAGALTDVLVVPLMIWRRTRPVGFVLALLFNLGTAILFSGPIFKVAMYPWIMIACVTIFLEPDWPRRLAARIGLIKRKTAAEPPAAARVSLTPLRWATLVCLGLYVLVQVLVPLRYHLYPGFHLWTGFGRAHAWQMMAASMHGRTTFIVTDPATGETWERTSSGAVGPLRNGRVQRVPALIHRYALHIREDMARRGRPGCEVRVESFASLNGRPMQRLVDPDVDLAESPSRWGYYSWVLPLEAPRPSLEQAGSMLAKRIGEDATSD